MDGCADDEGRRNREEREVNMTWLRWMLRRKGQTVVHSNPKRGVAGRPILEYAKLKPHPGLDRRGTHSESSTGIESPSKGK